MASSFRFGAIKRQHFVLIRGGQECTVCSQHLKCNVLSALLALHGVLARCCPCHCGAAHSGCRDRIFAALTDYVSHQACLLVSASEFHMFWLV